MSVSPRPLTIGIVAGETSGDILGAGLMRALKEKYPDVRFFGVAGPLMQAEGCETRYEMEELAVMGIVEVLGRLPRLLSIRRDLTRRFRELKPDVLSALMHRISISPGRTVKVFGIKTIHYVSPSVWAWRQNRVFKIAKATNLVLAFLPFEKRFTTNTMCRAALSATLWQMHCRCSRTKPLPVTHWGWIRPRRVWQYCRAAVTRKCRCSAAIS